MTKPQLIAHNEALTAERNVEARVLAVVQKVHGEGVTEADLVRAEMALTLARELDSPGSERPAPAQVSKELRAIVATMEKFCRDGEREGLFT